jgi:hypothetical protein
MTYRPAPVSFGMPLSSNWPSYMYLTLAMAVAGFTLAGENSSPGSWLFHYVVELDPQRVMSIRTFAACLLVGALAAVLRAGMSGVRIRGDGLEAREVHGWVVPKVRHFRWPQLERIVLDQKSVVALDLWDGSRAFLPAVRDRQGLSAALEQIAAARAIPVRGGAGLDEIPEPEEAS